jgi:hypothetical protein
MWAKKLSRFLGIIFRGYKACGWLFSRRVSRKDKALLLVPLGLYWVLPDLLPGLPYDDAAVTLMLFYWFVRRMEKKYPPRHEKGEKKHASLSER